eukprot:COSAG06_NODE_49926_length_322_cov_0.690583_1_plen_66_part_10
MEPQSAPALSGNPGERIQSDQENPAEKQNKSCVLVSKSKVVALFLSAFPHVCPEPVLAKRSFFMCK